MDIPERPTAGQVIRYAFLWRDEADDGRQEARKDRPAAVVIAISKDDHTQVIVAPITHTPPEDPVAAIELPADVKRQLGLDDAPSWLRADELNRFSWPGYDLRSVPGQDTVVYGKLPPGLYTRLKNRIVEIEQAARAGRKPRRIVDRD